MKRNDLETRIKEMLAESLLGTGVKDILKKNLKKYNEETLGKIAESLAREDIELGNLATELMRFDAESQKRWGELTNQQTEEANKFVEDAFQTMTR